MAIDWSKAPTQDHTICVNMPKIVIFRAIIITNHKPCYYSHYNYLGQLYGIYHKIGFYNISARSIEHLYRLNVL